jgi:hypothetical protein
MITKGEKVRMWKETVAAYLKVGYYRTFSCIVRRIYENFNQDDLYSGRDSNRIRPVYSFRVLLLQCPLDYVIRYALKSAYVGCLWFH